MTERSGTDGPIILWLDYGCEGWKPTSYTSIREALEAQKYGSNYRITRLVTYEVKETST